ncbi:RHS repeat-associated core domain-containing protein [Eubacteriales bacterium OttesenSCG-928-M02]|nr:RHS repeat-associated core domain-containing protein [Eubacteriales bacterium OttesenSCG-928-M02]
MPKLALMRCITKYFLLLEDRSLLLPNEGGEASGSLYYLSARHYDPNTGRFLQQDTYKGDSFNPWTQNLYAYTSNNPVNYVDPTGHVSRWVIDPPIPPPPLDLPTLDGLRKKIEEEIGKAEEQAKEAYINSTNGPTKRDPQNPYAPGRATGPGIPAYVPIDDLVLGSEAHEYYQDLVTFYLLKNNAGFEFRSGKAAADAVAPIINKLTTQYGCEFAANIGINADNTAFIGDLHYSAYNGANDSIDATRFISEAVQIMQNSNAISLSWIHGHPVGRSSQEWYMHGPNEAYHNSERVTTAYSIADANFVKNNSNLYGTGQTYITVPDPKNPSKFSLSQDSSKDMINMRIKYSGGY